MMSRHEADRPSRWLWVAGVIAAALLVGYAAYLITPKPGGTTSATTPTTTTVPSASETTPTAPTPEHSTSSPTRPTAPASSQPPPPSHATPHASPTHPSAVAGTPTPPKPTPPSTAPHTTEELHSRYNAGRPNSHPLARYPGMDGYAQEVAERAVACDRDQYAYISCGYSYPEAAPEPYSLAYDKLGIGYYNGYWVVVLNS